MIDIKIEKSGNIADITVGGELYILDGEELKNTLVEAINTCENVVIHTDEIEDIDSSSLQLLCAAHKMALNQKKTLVLQNNGSDVFQRAIMNAGFFRHVGCSLDINGSCLWIKGMDNG